MRFVVSDTPERAVEASCGLKIRVSVVQATSHQALGTTGSGAFLSRRAAAMNQTLCPYTVLPLNSLETVNREHILPSALGAPDSFVVLPDAAANTKMNELIDAPAVNDDVLRLLAVTQRVSSRSGSVAAKFHGVIEASGDAVQGSLSSDGVALKFRKPVDTGPDGFVSAVKGFGDEAAALAERIRQKYEAKGHQVTLGDPVSSLPNIKIGWVGDLWAVQRELTKIAYLYSVRILGDAAIDSPHGAMLRAAMLAADEAAVQATGIRGARTDASKMPSIFGAKQNEHLITCGVLPGIGILTSATLFGIFGSFFITPLPLGAAVPSEFGQVARMDASTGAVELSPFLELLPRLAQDLHGLTGLR